MKIIIMFVMVLVIGLTAGIANAALLASESFEYTAGASLAGQNGGTGWAGPWEGDSGATIGAGSLEHPDVGGTGNHVEVVDNTGNAEDRVERDLTTPLLDDGSTYWVSVVFQKSNNDNTSSWCGFILGENIWFGKGYGEDNLLLWDDADAQGSETGVPVTDLSWLVLKIETNPVAQEQVYLWVNPDAGAEPSTATANANLEIALGTGGADFFVIEYGSTTANSADFKCDEIKIGTSFNDVVDDVGRNPIIIDPNVMLVYETDETVGDFDVSLANQPESASTVTVTVDPNSDDITLLGHPPNETITMIFDANTWDVPQTVAFKAINDEIPEPPNLWEPVRIKLSSIYSAHATDPNWVGAKAVIVKVVDNDQPTQAGQIVAWGNNEYGQCNVPDPPNGFIAIAAGADHSLGLKDDGSVAAWGANYFGQCNVPTPTNGFVAIAAGYWYSLGLKDDGSVVGWGDNSYGQCDVPAPTNDFVAIAAGSLHSLALKDDGSVTAWGDNGYGQCNVPTPTNDFIAIAAGYWHSLGLKDDGSVAAWGKNDYGQCNVPAPTNGFVAIAAGSYHSLGLKEDGSVSAWGYNGYGQCNVPDPNGFVAIAAGHGHSLGLKEDGSVAAWGDNSSGQCNVPVPDPNGFFAIAAGYWHSLGLKGCQYELIGDNNNDCRVDLLDLALMAENWLIDCDLLDFASMAENWRIDCDAEPSNPACVPAQ